MRLAGKVVKEGNSARFTPDEKPQARLKLTGMAVQLPEPPERQEIDLQRYVSGRMSFDCQQYDDEWVWGVQEGSLEVDTRSA